MKRLLAGLSALVLAIPLLPCASPGHQPPAQVEALSDGARVEVTYTAAFATDDLIFEQASGYDRVRLEGSGYLKCAGRPGLPSKTVWIALPQGMAVTGVREVSSTITDLPGSYVIMPAQPPTPISGEAVLRPEAAPDPEVYSSSQPYPRSRVTLLHQADLAGQNMAAIRISPVQYSPASGRLTFATTIRIALEGPTGYTCGDYLPAKLANADRRRYEAMVKSMVVNPLDVRLTAPELAPRIQGVDPGQYDYVIITTAGWADDFQRLADWRGKLGRRVKIVTTDWIYTGGGYAGTDLEKIRAFISDAHTNWGTTDFVLGGDTHVIPYHVRTITVPTYGTDDIANDTYYADYDEDWVLEVNVARASVRTVGQINTFINKVFTYEKNPPLADYVETAAFFGFDITTCGDMDGELFKENYVRAMYVPATWTLDTEYDGEPGTHKADVIGYLNHGHHLVNHHDHCNTDCMGTGWICHSDLLYTVDMDTLSNGDRLSILFAVGCYPAHHPTAKSVGEASIRNPDGGCVAFMGNTCIGWGGPPEEPDLYSLGQDLGFYRNLFDTGIYRLGDNFTRLKNDEYDPDDPYNLHQYAFTQLHLLGDPGLTVWTEEPQTLAVSHPGSAPVGEPASFTVDVAGGGGGLDGATVCLWKAGDVFEVDTTSSGAAAFEFTAATEGTLYVTVSCHNYLPYEGQALVDAAASVGTDDLPEHPAFASVVPNPFSLSTRITYTIPAGAKPVDAAVEVYDCMGRHIRTLADGASPAGTHHLTWNGTDDEGGAVASGIYYCKLTYQGRRTVKQIVLLR
jgi:hypothetical protein